MIWHHHAGKWETANFGPFDSAFIVCQGPSLAKVDTAKLCGPGRVVVAVNNAYPYVRPDFWIGMDTPDCYEQRLFAEPFPKIMRGNYGGLPFQGKLMRDAAATYFADVQEGGDMWRYQTDGKFAWHNDTFRTALQFAMSLGVSTIYLVGVDLDTKDGHYAGGTALPDNLRHQNQHLYDDQFRFLMQFAKDADARGVKIISCSPESRINFNTVIPFVPADQVVSGIEAHVVSGRPKMHVRADGPLFCSYYTPAYAQEAEELRATLRQFQLPHEIVGVPDGGSWQANTQAKVPFIQSIRKRYPGRPLVYLDADARVRQAPSLFETIKADLAFHLRDGKELLSGTLYFGPTAGADRVLAAWSEENAKMPLQWDQRNLQAVLARGGIECTVAELPPAYCQIFDTMASCGLAVIEHMQASRRLKT